MPTSSEIIRTGLIGDAPREHSGICKCQMCMQSKIPTDIAEEHMAQLQGSMVDRRSLNDPTKSLMRSTEAHAILHAGTTVNMLTATGISKSNLPSAYDFRLTEPKETRVYAKWKHRELEAAQTGKDASVFGGLGVLLVPPNFSAVNIPTMNALAVPKSFLRKYGAELIPLDQPFVLDAVDNKELETLYLVQYDFDPAYIEEYVMKMAGGGGLFVETHPFPHVFTPLSKTCGGALILGVNRGNGAFDFVAFSIPYGFTMKIASNVIHGDSFFVGPYAIALTDTELADSVIFRQETRERSISQVVQTPVRPARLPILAEYRLSKAVNNLLMIEKLQHDGAKGKPVEFFQALATVVLAHVKDLSAQAHEAYRERVALLEQNKHPQISNIEFIEDKQIAEGGLNDSKSPNTDKNELKNYRHRPMGA